MKKKYKLLKKILEEENYWASQLYQNCTECSWESSELKEEIEKCPECGKKIDEGRTLAFGGLKVKYQPVRNRFTLKENYSGNEITIAENDCRETIAFLIRHFKFGS